MLRQWAFSEKKNKEGKHQGSADQCNGYILGKVSCQLTCPSMEEQLRKANTEGGNEGEDKN